MEAMFRTRGSGRSSDIETTIVPQFLAELDGVESVENLVIIGASNRQDMIDPAILRPGRLDVKIKLERPDLQSAQDIFSMYLLPTLPLNPQGLTLPNPTERRVEVVFRTAYRIPENSKQHTPHSLSVHAIGSLLPPRCDLRLARSFTQADLQELTVLPPKATIREAVANTEIGGHLWKRLYLLRADKAEMEVGELVTHLQALENSYSQNEELRKSVDYFIQQEWLAEKLLLQTVNLLYSSASTITVLTTNGNIHTFPLKDFMSGAVIANIVTRAKRQAIKRVLIDQISSQFGINQQDLYRAIEQEFEENKEQLAQHKLRADIAKVDAEVQSVEVHIETGESDPWSEEKIVLHKSTAPLRL